MTAPYRLEDLLNRPEVARLDSEQRFRVREAYIDTYAAYEEKIPYRHDRLPGIAGVAVYQLNKSICAYGAGLREAEKVRK